MAPPTPTAVMLVTGEYFDHLNPDPSVINLDVLEYGLQAPRFNGQTLRPISITEHSLRVARIADKLADAEYGSRALFRVTVAGRPPEVTRGPWDTDQIRLWALLHDAHEALTPWGDCLRPGKTPEMRDVEEHIDCYIIAAIRRMSSACIDPGWPSDDMLDIVKTADSIALYFEALLWQPGAIDWAHEVWPTPADDRLMIERFMPLIAPHPRECWRTEVERLLR